MLKDLYLNTLLNSFALLGIVFIPFTFDLFSFQLDVTTFLFGDLIRWILTLFYQETPAYYAISSDSSAMYVLLLVLFLVAICITIVTTRLKKWKDIAPTLFYWSQLIICYYLALQWFNYGFDKVFKGQFYLPEPNILYTPFGLLDKDILFWSTMGTSYTYNLFMGAMELLAAISLLFKKTRTLGLLLSLGILANILAINFSFDISLKLYASFLLLSTITALLPSIKSLYDFFIRQRPTTLKTLEIPKQIDQHWSKTYFKTFVVLLFILEGCIPYLQRQNFNDDLAARPYLHGAYAVQTDSTSINLPLKRLFIHRHGYLVFQYEDDSMQDYRLEIDTLRRQFKLTDYEELTWLLDYTYFENERILLLENKQMQVRGKALDWKALPALERPFHWTVD